MRLLSLMAAVVFTGVAPAYAQEAPDTAALRRLCVAVEKRATDLNQSSAFTYAYEPILWQLAGASPDEDDLETAKPKIRAFWNAHQDKLNCRTGRKSEPLLRFAIKHDFLELVEDLSDTYVVDLTFRDASDGKNLLEFMGEELMYTKSSGSAAVAHRRLASFYDYMKSLIKE